MAITLTPLVSWSDNPDPEDDILACPDCKSAPCRCRTGKVSGQYPCTGCGSHFMLRDLFVTVPGEKPEMHCLACLHQRILNANGGVGPDLASFHEVIGGPAVEPLRYGT